MWFFKPHTIIYKQMTKKFSNFVGSIVLVLVLCFFNSTEAFSQYIPDSCNTHHAEIEKLQEVMSDDEFVVFLWKECLIQFDKLPESKLKKDLENFDNIKGLRRVEINNLIISVNNKVISLQDEVIEQGFVEIDTLLNIEVSLESMGDELQDLKRELEKIRIGLELKMWGLEVVFDAGEKAMKGELSKRKFNRVLRIVDKVESLEDKEKAEKKIGRILK